MRFVKGVYATGLSVLMLASVFGSSAQAQTPRDGRVQVTVVDPDHSQMTCQRRERIRQHRDALANRFR